MAARRITALLLSLPLALPAAAAAKPWHGAGEARTVSVSAVSDDAAPGDPWSAVITVRGPGGRPVTDVYPVLSLRHQAGDSHFATGVPTGIPGRFRARLPAPPAGVYRLAVDDGTGGEYAVGVTRVRENTTGGSGPGPDGRLTTPLGAALVLAGFLAVALRRRHQRDPSLDPA